MDTPILNHICFVRKLNAPDTPEVNNLIERITVLAEQYNIKIVNERQLVPHDTLIISVGGDGTMLHAMRLSANAMVVCTGFHAGNLGFLNDFSAVNNVTQSINALFDMLTDRTLYEANLESRTALRVSLFNDIEVNTVDFPISFNDIAVSRMSSDQILEYELLVNGDSIGTHKANSILVSTPTGSTAYSLSAGGSIILPTANVIQIVPVAPNTLASRPLIIPDRQDDGTPVEIIVRPKPSIEYTSLRIDGRKPMITNVDQIYEVRITMNSMKARILHNPNWNFFNTLATKLGWLKDTT